MKVVYLIVLIFVSLCSGNSKDSSKKYDSGNLHYSIIDSIKTSKLNGNIGEFKLVYSTNIDKNKLFTEVSVPIDYELQEDSLFILCRENSHILRLSIKTGAISGELMEKSLLTTNANPINLEVSQKYFGINVSSGFIIQDRKNGNLMKVGNSHIQDFAIIQDFVFVVGDYGKNLTKYQINSDYIKEIGQFNLEGVDFHMPIFSNNTKLVSFHKGLKTIQLYKFIDEVYDIKKMSIPLNDRTYTYLEDLYGSRYAFLLANDAGMGEIMIWDEFKNDYVTAILPKEIPALGEHEDTNGPDLCFKDKIFCSAIQLEDKYGIFIFTHERVFYVYKFDYRI